MKLIKIKIFIFFLLFNAFGISDPFSNIRDNNNTITLLGTAISEKNRGAIIKFDNIVNVWNIGQENEVWQLKDVKSNAIILVNKITRKELILSI